MQRANPQQQAWGHPRQQGDIGARCPFEAKKGQIYRFAAASGLPKLDNLCIVVARP
jgi:hypothetical protein